MGNYEANLVYGIGWIVFGLTHSLLAAKTFKQMFSHILGGYYRILYNIIAIIINTIVVMYCVIE